MKTKNQCKLLGIFLPLMLLSVAASADNNQYWQQQQLMKQQQIINEMQSMRWAQERANREAQNQYWQPTGAATPAKHLAFLAAAAAAILPHSTY